MRNLSVHDLFENKYLDKLDSNYDIGIRLKRNILLAYE